MIRTRQQRTYGFFGSLFDPWLAYLNAGPLEAIAAMQAADKCIDTITQAILLRYSSTELLIDTPITSFNKRDTYRHRRISRKAL